MSANLLFLGLFGLLLLGIVQGTRKRKLLLAALERVPGARVRFYRATAAQLAVMTAVVPLAVAFSPDISAADVGWAWPRGDGLDYLLAALMLVMTAAVGSRARREQRAGRPVPGSAMRPHTVGERWLAAVMSVAVGTAEEVLFRALFLAVATRVLGLSWPVAVTASLVFFVAAHAYQGRRGMLSVLLVGFLLTVLYLISDSLLLPIVAHTCWDLVMLLLIAPDRATTTGVIPASPGPPAAPPPAASPPLRTATPD